MQDGRLSIERVQMEGRNKTHSLVTGNITWGMLWFAVPMILGNLLQQFYNIADTLIVGRFLGAKALAAVGSAYTLMIFLTSVLLGLCMGSGVVFSLQYGARDHEALKRSIFVSLVLIGVITLLLNIAVFVWIDPILRLLQVPAEVYILMRDYLWIIFWGIGFTFLYNYYASLLRAVGNSVLPLVFLAVAVVLNIVLDLVFILYFGWGVRGAALATVIAQAVSGIGLCTYIQGNFMIGNLPHLDGSTVDWAQYSGLRIGSVALWVAVAVLVILTVKKLSLTKVADAAGAVSGLISLVLLVTLVTLGFTKQGLEHKFSMINTTYGELEMSTDQNLVLLVLDTVDGDIMSQVIEHHPEYKETLSDFTYYNNTMSAYPFTAYSVPYLFSGEWYEDQEEFIEYAKRVYREAPFFDDLEARGYRMGMYEEEAYRLEESMLRFENMIDTTPTISSIAQFMKLEIKLVGFKYMPFDLKRFCLTIPAEFNSLEKTDDISDYELFSSDNQAFYTYLKKTPVTLTDDKCFRFIHLVGAHSPWHQDAQMNEIENGTYEQSIEASMTIVATYLQKLKDSGVYDNTAIMILSDHGYNIEDDDSSEKRQHPILFVKGVGEHYDELQISSAPISQSDYLEAYTRLLDGKQGDAIFDYKEGDARERRFLFYDYDEPTHFYEYMQTGYAGDVDTMYFTGVEITP